MEKISVSGEIRVDNNVVADGAVRINLDGQSFKFSFQSSSERTTLRYPSGELLAEVYAGADVSHLTPAQVTLADMVFFLTQQLFRVWRMGSSAGVLLAAQFESVNMSSGVPTTLALSLPANEEQARLLREAVAPLQQEVAQ